MDASPNQDRQKAVPSPAEAGSLGDAARRLLAAYEREAATGVEEVKLVYGSREALRDAMLEMLLAPRRDEVRQAPLWPDP